MWPDRIRSVGVDQSWGGGCCLLEPTWAVMFSRTRSDSDRIGTVVVYCFVLLGLGLSDRPGLEGDVG